MTSKVWPISNIKHNIQWFERAKLKCCKNIPDDTSCAIVLERKWTLTEKEEKNLRPRWDTNPRTPEQIIVALPIELQGQMGAGRGQLGRWLAANEHVRFGRSALSSIYTGLNGASWNAVKYPKWCLLCDSSRIGYLSYSAYMYMKFAHILIFS